MDGNEYEITSIGLTSHDVSDDNVGYGPLKSALSEDNWLAFGIEYFDGADYHQAILSVQVPEPSTAGVILSLGASSLLRRRRRSVG